jgi:malonate transporter
MADILSLALPFFGLIFLGFVSGKIGKIPEDGMAWLNFFILYVALPALFFQLISRTPIEELANWRFVIATTLCTFASFVLAFFVGLWARRGNWPEATIAGVVGSYANVGYMGPGLTLAALGPQATVPTALIFTFDFDAILRGGAVSDGVSPVSRRRDVCDDVALRAEARLHAPLYRRDHSRRHRGLGALDAAGRNRQDAGVSEKRCRALRTFHARRHGRAATLYRRSARSAGITLVGLLLHPLLVWLVLGTMGNINPVWVYTAVLMAGLPPALNAFIMARQYNVYVEESSNGILIGTIASVLTVTALLYLIERKLLPVALFQ